MSTTATPVSSHATHPQTAGGPPQPQISRQMVNFAFFKLDGAVRRLPAAEKQELKQEFVKLFAERRPGMLCLTYSTVGTKAETDFLLWRISLSTDNIQAHSAEINRSKLGAYLSQPNNFLAMTKRSMYIDRLDPFHAAESRTHIIPGKRKYLFIYPFVKTREWYLLSKEARQEIMDEHIKVGNKYPSVKLNTTYSFGLDDQDFVVAFESDEPKDFLDLVMELRETQSSKYTVRDTPIWTAVQTSMEQILEQLF